MGRDDNLQLAPWQVGDDLVLLFVIVSGGPEGLF